MISTTNLPPPQNVFNQCKVIQKEKETGINGNQVIKKKVLGIGASERSWGDVKTIKSGKRSDISSDVSEKQSIFCTSACIESDIIEQYN